MDKSYVTLEQKVCIVCGHPYDTNALLLDKSLRPRFEQHTVTGWGMCVEHENLKQAGYVALCVCKNAHEGQTLKPEDADRTGEIIHLKAAAFQAIFAAPVPPKMFCFCDDQVASQLKLRAQQPKQEAT